MFVAHLILTTYYVIDGSFLTIKSGFVVCMKIDIKTITTIVETNSIIGAPATSFDRLNILYNRHDNVLISPKDKSGFIDHVMRINPHIDIHYTSKKKK